MSLINIKLCQDRGLDLHHYVDTRPKGFTSYTSLPGWIQDNDEVPWCNEPHNLTSSSPMYSHTPSSNWPVCTLPNLYATQFTLLNLYATQFTLLNLYATQFTLLNLYATQFTLLNLYTTKFTLLSLYATQFTLPNLYATQLTLLMPD